MVSLADVKRWNPGVLEDVLRTVQKHEQILTYSGDDFGRVIPAEGWSGPAAVTAGSAHQSLMSRLDTMAAGNRKDAPMVGMVGRPVVRFCFEGWGVEAFSVDLVGDVSFEAAHDVGLGEPFLPARPG